MIARRRPTPLRHRDEPDRGPFCPPDETFVLAAVLTALAMVVVLIVVAKLLVAYT